MSHVRQQGTVLTRHDRCPTKVVPSQLRGPCPVLHHAACRPFQCYMQAEAASQAASGLGWWQTFAHIYGTCIQTMPSITT